MKHRCHQCHPVQVSVCTPSMWAFSLWFSSSASSQHFSCPIAISTSSSVTDRILISSETISFTWEAAAPNTKSPFFPCNIFKTFKMKLQMGSALRSVELIHVYVIGSISNVRVILITKNNFLADAALNGELLHIYFPRPFLKS